MPRRSSTRTINLPQSLKHQSPSPPPPSSTVPENLAIIRTQWKWAAVSQFFLTFAPVLAMDEVTVNDVEADLVQGSSNVLPRIMQRLLYILTYDRKVSLDTWQNALRKQYRKRNPDVNPIGPEIIPPAYLPSPSPLEEEEGADVQAPTEGNGDDDQRSSEPVERDPDAVDEGAEGGKKERDHPVDAEPTDGSSKPDAPQPNGRSTPQLETEEQKDWNTLPMLVKLDSLHMLTEWQFHNATRIRTMMRCDDDIAVSWRIEPIGYDAKCNAYWHIGNRLWLQRVPPSPKKSLKRKRPVKPKAPAPRTAKQPSSSKRPRLQSRGAKSKAVPTTPSDSVSGRSQRAAKAQANLKLDAQAKELTRLNQQAELEKRGRSSPSKPPTRQQPSRGAASTSQNTPTRPVGTRASARLRGAQEDEEWQAIPAEWLKESTSKGRTTRSGAALKTGLESDLESSSDLTELSEDSDDDDEEAVDPPSELDPPAAVSEEPEQQEDEEVKQEEKEEEETPANPEGFVEWETICVTLEEWEHIAERFEKATHYAEKALYKRLTNFVVPLVMEELREQKRKKELEEAFVHRKRSSRIALKESEKEEARAAARKRVEEEEKMSRARRLEMRQQKEEGARKESAREQRRREREAKELSRAASPKPAPSESVKGAVSDLGLKTHEAPRPRKLNGNGMAASSGTASGSRTPVGDDWILDCEICHRRGVNLDDGVPMMCCGSCSRWQHIACHDRNDYLAGRPKRNWDVVEFFCQECRIARSQSAQPPRQHQGRLQLNTVGSSQPISSSYYKQSASMVSPSNMRYDRRMDYHPPNPASNHSTYPHHHHLPHLPHPDASYRAPTNSPMHAYPHPHPQPQLQPSISFSHYQPQHHGFSNSPDQHNQYQGYHHPPAHHVGTGNHLPRLHEGVPYNGWNHPTQTAGYNPLYNTSSTRSSAPISRQEPSMNNGVGPALQPTHIQWQPPSQPVPTQVPGPSPHNIHHPHMHPHPPALTPPQARYASSPTPYGYHRTSYQSPAS